MSDQALKAAVKKWRERSDGGSGGNGIDVRPSSAYEAVTREMVLALRAEIAEVKSRLNGLLFMVAGGIVLDLAARIAGFG